MNTNVLWTLAAVGIYWLAVAARGTDETRDAVALLAIVVAFANVLRYLPKAWEKYRTGATAGEWRMLMGLELFWLGFGSRETWLLGGRWADWPVTGSPWNGFFAFWILCAGVLCYSAASEPLPTFGRQNLWVIGAATTTGALLGMLLYRALWG